MIKSSWQPQANSMGTRKRGEVQGRGLQTRCLLDAGVAGREVYGKENARTRSSQPRRLSGIPDKTGGEATTMTERFSREGLFFDDERMSFTCNPWYHLPEHRECDLDVRKDLCRSSVFSDGEMSCQMVTASLSTPNALGVQKRPSRRLSMGSRPAASMIPPPLAS
jgi:hypothetical protein